jgi:electron transport complex protein RnfA
MKYLELTVGAALVYNFVLTRFLGICPFLGVSRRLSTAMGMSGAVVFVMTAASCCTALIYNHLLKFHLNGQLVDLSFLQVLVFILVIAALVQMIEIVMQKLTPGLYQALGI